MRTFKKMLFVLGIISIVGTSLLAISQELSVQGKKNLRSANMHLGGKRYEKALPFYEQVLDENPNHVEALGYVASIYYDLKKDYVKARELYEIEINIINQIFAKYEELKNVNEKEAKKYFKTNIKKPKLEKKLKDAKNLHSSCWVKLFKEAQETEDPNDALKKWEYVYEVAPDSIKTIKMLAYTYKNLENTEKMLEYMIVAAEMDPKDVNNRLQIASMYYDQEDYEAAASWFLEAAKLDSENSDHYYNAGLAYKNAKKDTLSYMAFIQSFELDSENISTAVEISNIFAKLDQTDKSLFYLIKAVELDPENKEFLSFLCSKMSNLKKYDELIPYAEKWKKLETDPVQVQNIEQLINFAKQQQKK